MRHQVAMRGAAGARTLLFLACTLVTACSSQYRVNELATALRQSGDASNTLAQLESRSSAQRDRGLYLLSQGQLELLTGRFTDSIASLQSAKRHFDELLAISVTETLGASTINETLRAYVATPGERVFLHETLALNYLLLGELDAARVEVLQADVLMGQLAESGETIGQVASTRYLGGLVFELNREWDDALISYRKAAEILDRRGQPIPPALRQSLLDLTIRNGLTAEHNSYRERFGLQSKQPRPHDHGDIVLLFWQGQVSQLRQRSVAVYAPELGQTVSLAMPSLPLMSPSAAKVQVEVGGNRQATATLEDLDRLARHDLEQRSGAIMAASLVRVVAKQQAVRLAQKDSPQLGALINLTTLLSEVADLRSWNMLPARVQVVRISAPAGDNALLLNAGDWHRSISVNITPNRPCVLLAVETNRQIFNQACRIEPHARSKGHSHEPPRKP